MSNLNMDHVLKEQEREVFRASHDAEDAVSFKNPIAMDLQRDEDKRTRIPGMLDSSDASADVMVEAELERRGLDKEARRDENLLRSAEKGWIERKTQSIFAERERRAEEERKLLLEAEKARQEEERRKEEKRRQDEEQERAKQNAKDQAKAEFDRKHTPAENSRRIKKIDLLVRRNMAQNRRTGYIKHVPTKKSLTTGYSSRFNERISLQKRMDKQGNKRSQLFQKIANHKMLEKAGKKVKREYLAVMEAGMRDIPVECGVEDYHDLAVFMDNERDTVILKRFLGTGEGPGGREGQDTRRALELMLEKLLLTDVDSLNLETDTDIASNAERLERLSGRVAAFDRLAEKTGFFEGLENDVRTMLEGRLNALRSIAAYYMVRKELMGNTYFRDHYNDELSMDVTSAGDDDRKKEVAELLIRSWQLGRIMLLRNGSDRARADRRGTPRFSNQAAASRFQEICTETKNKENQKKLVAGYHKLKDTDYLDARRRHNSPIEERRFVQAGEQALRQQQEYDNKNLEREKENAKKEWETIRKKAVENALLLKEIPEYADDYKDEPYSEERLNGILDEFEALNPGSVFMGSYKEMVGHFNENAELCHKAKNVHRELVRGISRGYRIDDNRLNALRAKFLFFHEVNCSIHALQNMVIKNEDGILEKTDQEFAKKLERLLDPPEAKLEREVALPGDMDALYRRILERIQENYNNRDRFIREVWAIRQDDGKFEPEKTPEEEVSRKRQEYAKNAVITEFASQKREENFNCGNSDSIISAWYVSQGKEIPQNFGVTRLQYSILYGRSASEVIRLYRLLNGTPGEKFAFWREGDERARRVPFKDFSARDLTTWFDDFDKKLGTMEIYANVNDITNSMASLIRDPKTKGWLKLPQRYKSLEEMELEGNTLFGLGCNFASSWLGSLAQMRYNKYAPVFNLNEIGNHSEDFVSHAMDKLEEFDDEVLEGLSAADIKQLNSAVNNVSSTVIKTQLGRSTFDTDLDEVYKKEKRYHQYSLTYQEGWEVLKEDRKKALEAYNESFESSAKLRNERLKAEGRQDTLFNARSSAVNSMAFLHGDSEERSVLMYQRLLVNSRSATAEERRKKSLELERVFDAILSFDIKEMSFESIRSLITEDKLKVRMLSAMANEIEPLIEDYRQLMRSEDSGCALNEETLKEVMAKKLAINDAGGWFTLIPELAKDSGLLNKAKLPDFILLSPEEMLQRITDLQSSKGSEDQKLAELYLKVLALKEHEAGPGADPVSLYEERRAELKLQNKDGAQKALSEIRKRQQEEALEEKAAEEKKKEEQKKNAPGPGQEEKDGEAADEAFVYEEPTLESVEAYLSKADNEFERRKSYIEKTTKGRRSSSMNQRIARGLSCNLSILKGQGEEEALKLYNDLMIASSGARSYEKRKHTLAIERVMEAVLSFDMKELSFNDISKPLSEKSMKLMFIMDMAMEFNDMLDDYERLMKDPEAGCALSAKEFAEVKLKRGVMQDIAPFYSSFPKAFVYANKRGLSVLELLKLSVEELTEKSMMARDKEEAEMYSAFLSIKFNEQKTGFTAGKDAGEVYKREHDKGLGEKNDSEAAIKKITERRKREEQDSIKRQQRGTKLTEEELKAVQDYAGRIGATKDGFDRQVSRLFPQKTSYNRQHKAMAYGMGVFTDTKKEPPIERYRLLELINKKNPETDEKKKLSLEYEKVFSQILSFDINSLYFEDPMELISEENFRRRVMGYMVFDMEYVFSAYEKLIDDKKAGCALTKDLLKEVRARRDIIADYYAWYDKLPILFAKFHDILETKDMKQLFSLTPQEIMKMDIYKNPSLHQREIEFYTDLMLAVGSQMAAPGADTEALLEKRREKYNVPQNAADNAKNAIRNRMKALRK